MHRIPRRRIWNMITSYIPHRVTFYSHKKLFSTFLLHCLDKRGEKLTMENYWGILFLPAKLKWFPIQQSPASLWGLVLRAFESRAGRRENCQSPRVNQEGYTVEAFPNGEGNLSVTCSTFCRFRNYKHTAVDQEYFIKFNS